MKTETKAFQIIPYGLPKGRLESFKLPGLQISKTWKRPEAKDQHRVWQLLVTFSHLLDDAFVTAFHKNATRHTRLLVLNDSLGSDWLASRLVNLQIRSPERFYVAEAKWAAGKQENWDVVLQSLLSRLTAAHDTKDSNRRILDARFEDGVLRTVSADFRRLAIPVAKIPPLAKAALAAVQTFEIDTDGSYLYWPKLDVHLGWEQLAQIVDPIAVHKAKQKSREFNVRYGAAIQQLRQDAGLALNAIPGLSDKQLRRIERGDCRLTSNAAESLAQAHGMQPNEYLQAVAALLK
jgi:hypothetical protein